MLQADDSHKSECFLDCAYEDDLDEDRDDHLSVTFEGLMAFLSREKDESLQEKQSETTEISRISDKTDADNVPNIQIGQVLSESGEHGLLWRSSEYLQMSNDRHETGLGALSFDETNENCSQPNSSETFYNGRYNMSEESTFKDEPCDLLEYFGQSTLENGVNHFPVVATATPLETGSDQKPVVTTFKYDGKPSGIGGNDGNYGIKDGNFTQGLTHGFLGSSSDHAYLFGIQDNFNEVGFRNLTAFGENLFASKPCMVPDLASSNGPMVLMKYDGNSGINIDTGMGSLAMRDSCDMTCHGSLPETADSLPCLSCTMGEPIFSEDKRADQLFSSRNLSIESKVWSVEIENRTSNSCSPLSVIDLDASPLNVNYPHQMSLDASSAESSSVPLTQNSSVPSYIGFKNVLLSANPNGEVKNSLLSTFGEHIHSVSEVIHSSPLTVEPAISNDIDICVLEETNSPSVLSSTIHSTLHAGTISGYSHSYEEMSVWPKADDERLTLQMALLDLSQAKSEASPPDGVLSVPLLRHQRIALSWMVHKETSGFNCSGGILADDQGLGKTISTIALILTERPPSLKKCNEMVTNQVEIETLNLDDDEDVVADSQKMRKLTENDKGCRSVKGRPAAGTLVVCPTSVLRQWAEELKNKVTKDGNLSFLIYHGGNRTRDPDELSKYDVILTTYSIVTMEVPKLLVSERDDEEKVKSESHAGLSTNKKRKAPNTSKLKNIIDNSISESTARPLARVAWFRVVLDEAQTIKNYRTQVARACCGLRAKRRWCLSGTPIQNAIDDLYSYFRFLRYDPYAAYRSFCSTIKIPISKNPAKGYKKLQLVLKTIMLRRTKASLLDGQPIISLPPKLVTLKKVDFSEAERTFYLRLEAESCEQFKVYAAAGTVKQNYVNILLMLLRLRQACDHPLLVQESDTESAWKSSMESARKLPWSKKMELLNNLEASLALCTICNDPPEDAVVSLCGHVFCNQCVSERVSSDDNHCPALRCKAKLDNTSIFPKSSLSGSLSSVQRDDTPSDSCLEHKASEPLNDIISLDSSKIKAAMEILLSLPRLVDSTPTTCSRGDQTVPLSIDAVYSCQEKCIADIRTEKAIVFSQWTRMLDLLELRLKNSAIQYRRLDGIMSVASREKAVKDFNTIPEVTVIIMSLKAASLGLNLIAACHVLLLDLWWNPTTEDQAIDRAHRIGQTSPVTVSRLTVNNTVEDRILLLQEKKRKMVASAFGEDETGGRQSRLTIEDLKYLFMFGS